jgi:hypothetical protein
MLENTNQIIEAACYYDLESYLFSQVAKRFEQGDALTAFDFYAIITWKANRTKTIVRDGLASRNLSPTELMNRVRNIPDDPGKLQALDDVPGIGIPIASAILTVFYPKRFTVLDFRAWETLYDLKRVSSKTLPGDVEGYFKKYLPECQRLASDWKMSLRELDVALWGWSQKKDLEKLAAT